MGKKVYTENCAKCHAENGLGKPPAYPPLANNPSIQMQSAVNPIRMTLNGGYPPSTGGNPMPHGMPPFAQALSDTEVAAVVTYIRMRGATTARRCRRSRSATCVRRRSTEPSRARAYNRCWGAALKSGPRPLSFIRNGIRGVREASCERATRKRMHFGERFNSISHLVGTVLSVAGLAALVTMGALEGDPYKVVSFAVYGAMLFALYAFPRCITGRAIRASRRYCKNAIIRQSTC